MLDTLLTLSSVKIEVVSESSRMRPVDVPILMGDPTKFCKATSWAPVFTFEQTMADLLNYWRARVANESASLQAQP
jgi:GDP-4-dehydro-6-deoxy-D-mannose reductase